MAEAYWELGYPLWDENFVPLHSVWEYTWSNRLIQQLLDQDSAHEEPL
jgi:hypothetical protein